MKPTSAKATGLLSGFNFQNESTSFFEKELSRSQPKTEEVSHRQPEEVRQGQTQPNEAADSRRQPSASVDSQTQPNEAKLSTIKPRSAKTSQSKPKRLAEKASRIPMPESHQGVASQDGKRTKRITILMSEEERKFINREARRHGMTIGELVYSLAVAASESKIELEDFLEE